MKSGISALPAADPEAPANLVDATKVVIWGLVFWGAELLAAAVFERNATAMAAAQAAVAEWGAGRMRIAWSEEVQKRLTVTPGTWSQPSRTAAIRAMLKPCSPPGSWPRRTGSR